MTDRNEPSGRDRESGRIRAPLPLPDNQTEDVLLRAFASIEPPSADDAALVDALFRVFGACEGQDCPSELQLGFARDVLRRAPSGFCGSLAVEAANRQSEYLDARRRTLGPDEDIPWDEYDRQLYAVYTAAWAAVDRRSEETNAARKENKQASGGSDFGRNPAPNRSAASGSGLRDAVTHIRSLSPSVRSEYVRSLLRDFLNHGVLTDREMHRLAVGMTVVSGEKFEGEEEDTRPR